MSVLAALGAAAASLATIGASIGATEGLEKLREWKLSKNPNAMQLSAIANSLLDYASKKGNRVYEKIVQKIEDIFVPIGMSSELKTHLAKASRRLKGLRDEIADVNSKISQQGAALSGLVSTHEMLTNSGKLGKVGEAIREEATKKMSDIQNQTSNLDKIEQQI